MARVAPASVALRLQTFFYFVQTNLVMLGDPRKWQAYLRLFGTSSEAGLLNFCVFPMNHYHKVALTSLVPAILLLELGCVALVNWTYLRWKKRLAEFRKYALIRASAYLLLFSCKRCWLHVAMLP